MTNTILLTSLNRVGEYINEMERYSKEPVEVRLIDEEEYDSDNFVDLVDLALDADDE